MQQGDGEKGYLNRQHCANELRRNAKVFDLFDASSGEAIGVKLLNTQAFDYARYPQRIFQRLKTSIDAAANYSKPRTRTDLDPAAIKSKVIQLAIPEFTSQAQRLQLFRAIRYGKANGVKVVVTRIRD